MDEEYRSRYDIYLGLAESYGFEPLPYEEWFKEEYEQEQIDLFMTDSEKYGD